MSDRSRQPEKEELRKKPVSAKVQSRLAITAEAIAATKQIMSFGAGNQREAIRASKLSSTRRTSVVKDLKEKYWEIHPAVQKIADQNPEALTTAKALRLRAGNCGEHAMVMYNQLRVTAKGDWIEAVSASEDHAWVLLGDRNKEPHNAVVAADAWPTKATACLWEDHFEYTANQGPNAQGDAYVETQRKGDEKSPKLAMQADGNSQVDEIEAIKDGVKLSAEGLKELASIEQMDEDKAKVTGVRSILDRSTELSIMYDSAHRNNFYTHTDSAHDDNKYNYIPETTR